MNAGPTDRILVDEQDVYVLTRSADRELRGSDTALSALELEFLVLIDGHASVAEIARRNKTLVLSAVIDVFRSLIARNLIELSRKDAAEGMEIGDFLSSPSFYVPPAGAEREAGDEAAAGVSSLQQTGYYVRIARRTGSDRKLVEGQRLCVIVIEDEPHLAKLLRQYLTLEGFDARVASNREEIVAEFRRPPPPDLVLLDVMLPDADGFDVLYKMRTHPRLKSVPTIMLTSKATREAVLKGLAGGADGYITKPFEIDVLVKAVRAVLGLPEHR